MCSELEITGCHTLLFTKGGVGPRGRRQPQAKWRDGITDDITEGGLVVIFCLARGRNRWRHVCLALYCIVMVVQMDGTGTEYGKCTSGEDVETECRKSRMRMDWMAMMIMRMI